MNNVSAMLKFQEAAKCGSGSDVPTHPQAWIARRYVLQRKLGNGSFGTVYLVSDKKAKQGEELKVLKEISVGELNPNQSTQASSEAQLLSKLDHPAIVRFHESFMEQANFCIITEYCEGGDLNYKIQEYKEAGKIFPENQIVEWFIQLLLGVDYMHERRILHRDLKSKNIFLKNNLLKIGDFGVSRLLMGSCDLATTLTGTPHYMSPEALTHQGYDTKSDIWSLACILYEMCCMNHAFTGSSFLSIILKIVEGDTPSLPERYPRKLNSIMESMLNKKPWLRPSAIEILKAPYIDEQLQYLMCRYSKKTQEDVRVDHPKEAAHIVNAIKTVEEKYEENKKQMQELRVWNFAQLNIDDLGKRKHLMGMEEKGEWPEGRHSCSSQEKDEERQPALEEALDGPPSENRPASPVPSLDPDVLELSTADTTANLHHHEIPEDPRVAEEYYADGFDSCSEGSEEQEEETVFPGPEWEIQDESPSSVYRTNQQDSDTEALVRCLENALNCSSLDTRTTSSVAADLSRGPTTFNSTTARAGMKQIRDSAMQKLGVEVFDEVYSYLRRARRLNTSETEVQECLERLVPRASDCFEVDQLLYLEEQLLTQNHLQETDRT